MVRAETGHRPLMNHCQMSEGLLASKGTMKGIISTGTEKQFTDEGFTLTFELLGWESALLGLRRRNQKNINEFRGMDHI